MKLCHDIWASDLDVRASYIVNDIAKELLLEYCKKHYIKMLLLVKKNKVKLREIDKGSETEENKEKVIEMLTKLMMFKTLKSFHSRKLS